MSIRKQHPNFPLKLNLESIKDLEQTLGYPIVSIKYFCKNKTSNVKELTLMQYKNGKLKEPRIVYNPTRQYKKLLRVINSKLLAKADLPDGVLGGVIGKCIDDMVYRHCNQEAVLSMDMKKFFPNINSDRVMGFLRAAGCSPQIAGILTDSVTLDSSLPQGFPTSPMLANLIAFGLDDQHLSQARKNNLHRTRWIDDIVFSGRSKDLKACVKSLLGAIKFHGFQLSNKKTEYQVRAHNPIIAGLNVAGKTPQLPIIVFDRIRDILHECKHSGVDVVQLKYESDSFGRMKDLKSSLKGRILYVSRYNEIAGKELIEIFDSIDWRNK
jgi:RNA-directed DNA polymerase